MLGGVTGVLVLVAGVLVVLLIAGVALVLHARQRRRRPQEAPRTSWPRAAAQQGAAQQADAPEPDGSRPTERLRGEGHQGTRAPERGVDATTRLPLARGPVDRSPIDSARAQRDPDTVVTRRDPPDGSVFRPPAPPPR